MAPESHTELRGCENVYYPTRRRLELRLPIQEVLQRYQDAALMDGISRLRNKLLSTTTKGFGGGQKERVRCTSLEKTIRHRRPAMHVRRVLVRPE